MSASNLNDEHIDDVDYCLLTEKLKETKTPKEKAFEYLKLFQKGKKAEFKPKFKAYIQVIIESFPVCFTVIAFPLIILLTFNFLKGEITQIETIALGFASNYQQIFGLFAAFGIGEMVGINCSEAMGRNCKKSYWKFFYMGGYDKHYFMFMFLYHPDFIFWRTNFDFFRN